MAPYAVIVCVQLTVDTGSQAEAREQAKKEIANLLQLGLLESDGCGSKGVRDIQVVSANLFGDHP